VKDIQLALQGGGAKISALLAVAEAVQTLHQQNAHIRVRRVAGTSAGAIVGAFLAAGIRMADVRAELAGGKGRELTERFNVPSLWSAFWSSWKGRAFWSTDHLETWLRNWFNKADVVSVQDCEAKTGIKLIVMATNLGSSTMVPYEGSHDLVSALLDSCGLPFCFRSWQTGNSALIVDGGIGENLPVDALAQEGQHFGEMIAVTFKRRPPGKPDTALKFAGALLSTAMDISVQRASARLADGRVHVIETEVSTFDFGKALTDGLNEQKEYGTIRSKASVFFSSLRDDPLRANPWDVKEPVLRGMMSELSQMYEATHGWRKLCYKSVVMEATARCLEGYAETDTQLDTLATEMVFAPANDSVACHAISIANFDGREYHGRIDPRVFRPTGEEIECIMIPCLASGRSIGADERQMLLFFDKWLEPEIGDYRLRFRDEAHGIMKGLRNKGRDELGIMLPRATGTIGSITIVLHVPDSWSEIGIAEAEPKGRMLTAAETDRDFPAPHNGYRTIGWTASNIDSSQTVVVNYHNRSRAS
jgi:predicted acylesterase/phospholipase RssA